MSLLFFLLQCIHSVQSFFSTCIILFLLMSSLGVLWIFRSAINPFFCNALPRNMISLVYLRRVLKIKLSIKYLHKWQRWNRYLYFLLCALDPLETTPATCLVHKIVFIFCIFHIWILEDLQINPYAKANLEVLFYLKIMFYIKKNTVA